MLEQEQVNEGPDLWPAPENSRPYDGEVAKVKAAAVRHDQLTTWILGGALPACTAVGIALWFLESVKDRDNMHFGFACGVAGMVFFIIALGSRLLFPEPGATCPQCGCDWKAESNNDTQRWMAWSCCPECGLHMGEEIPHVDTGENSSTRPKENQP